MLTALQDGNCNKKTYSNKGQRETPEKSASTHWNRPQQKHPIRAFLLTNLLFDLLRQSPAARIVNVSSTAAFVTSSLNLDDLQAERSYNALLAYGTTKLWNILFTQELARRLRAHGITNVLHPGLIASNFGAQAQGPFKWFLQLWRPLMLLPEKGAKTSIFLATDPSVATTSGGYFVKKRPEPVKSAYATAANAQRLWELSEQLTDTTFLA